jgi:integrase
VVRIFLIEMHRRQRSLWGWTLEEWCESVCANGKAFLQRYGRRRSGQHFGHVGRPLLSVVAYLLDALPDPMPLLEMRHLAPMLPIIFRGTADPSVEQLIACLQGWGYQQRYLTDIVSSLAYLLLRNHSPYLADLTREVLEEAQAVCNRPQATHFFQISQALHALGIISAPLSSQSRAWRRNLGTSAQRDDSHGMAPEWFSWCVRWKQQSTRQHPGPPYYQMLKAGRWLQGTHPEVTSPAQWDSSLAAEYIAAVNTWKVGEWLIKPKNLIRERVGQPLRPRAKVQAIEAMRLLLRDCQEWGWIPRTLNPDRALRIPRSLRSLIGPDPQVIDKERWAKLLWAAMNLQDEDLPRHGSRNANTFYPIEMVRALAVVWCFAALRSDEIWRLRLGCIRWQYEDVMIPESGEVLPRDAVCFLEVPVNKTGTAYTKAVHPVVGQRIQEWEQVRPKQQPAELDHKTSETVQFLFALRGRRIWQEYINTSLIPLLCKKAGIPEQDSRGTITSHRARSTIASMLYNSREPLDIFQLKEYLGHKCLSSTQHYLKVDPTQLASKVAKAGYLEQNLATVEVLLDQEAVMNGAASRGEAWKYYDLGHGFCTNPFWAQCAHRMACARCPFYRPKGSLKEQLVEGKANLVHMLEFVSLTEDEKALVTEGVELHQELLKRLADVPTPAGPTPRELEAERTQETKIIPLKSVRQTKGKRSTEP